MSRSHQWTGSQTLFAAIVLVLCGIGQVRICCGQTKASGPPPVPEPFSNVASAKSLKESLSGDRTTHGAVLSLSMNSQAPSPSVTLTWTASVSANKPSSDPVIGYNVYRGLSSRAYDTSPINTPAVKDVTFVDVNVERGKTYFYAVKTVTASGVESDFSNEAKAVIPPAPH
jgi:hypothetical protein